MDSVSANFLVDVFRALPIDCVRNIGPYCKSSAFKCTRFAKELRRFVKRYRWRSLVIQRHPDGTHRYGALEQRDKVLEQIKYEFVRAMDVANFSDLGNLHFDSIVVDTVHNPKDTFPEWSKIPNTYSDHTYLCHRFPTDSMITAKDEDQLRRIIDICTVPGCLVIIRDVRKFPARCALEHICSRISKLLCDYVETVYDKYNPKLVYADNLEKFLKTVLSHGKLETIILKGVVVNDPNILSALIKQCEEVEITEWGFFTVRSYSEYVRIQTRVTELLELIEQGHVHRSFRYQTYQSPIKGTGQFAKFVKSKGFQLSKDQTRSREFTKTVGSVEISVQIPTDICVEGFVRITIGCSLEFCS